MVNPGRDPLSPDATRAVSPGESVGDPEQGLFAGEKVLVSEPMSSSLERRVDHCSILMITSLAGLKYQPLGAGIGEVVDKRSQTDRPSTTLIADRCAHAVDVDREIKPYVGVQEEAASLRLVGHVDASLARKEKLAQACSHDSK